MDIDSLCKRFFPPLNLNLPSYREDDIKPTRVLNMFGAQLCHICILAFPLQLKGLLNFETAVISCVFLGATDICGLFTHSLPLIAQEPYVGAF